MFDVGVLMPRPTRCSVGWWACLTNIDVVPTVTLSVMFNTLEAIMVSHRTVVGPSLRASPATRLLPLSRADEIHFHFDRHLSIKAKFHYAS